MLSIPNAMKGTVRNMSVVVRKILLLFVLLLVSACMISACAANSSDQPDPTNLLTPDSIAKQVAAHYGESHVQIVSAKSDKSDSPPHEPIYLMAITGHFIKGSLVASTLDFSALADKMYVWNIYAYDENHQEIWHDQELKL